MWTSTYCGGVVGGTAVHGVRTGGTCVAQAGDTVRRSGPGYAGCDPLELTASPASFKPLLLLTHFYVLAMATKRMAYPD
ncbi:unnamed protein product [Lota lota]